ncbi:CsbD family protein [Chthonobacter rhizosphaerae]|uniref:CsbD family protein n=1 Tax=Chthonobacter rhizosphaerae TaxID=2735553 RepID=UPI0015EF116E|nr:CsbD family protein [Chthonobacter rhizosphaerae]
MASSDDKAKGTGNEAAGNIKQAAGKLTGDDKMRSEGAVQEKKGEGQQALGKAKDKIKGAVDGL